MTTSEKWDYVFASLGIKEFVDFLTSSELQMSLLPLKIFFIIFTILFFCLVMYFYINSSYIKYQFSRNVSELFAGKDRELASTNNRWIKIISKTKSGLEQDYKIAIVQADDFLKDVLKERGYKTDDFDDLIKIIDKKLMPNYEKILEAHEIRDSVVFDLDYKLDVEKAKNILDEYESAIKNLAV